MAVKNIKSRTGKVFIPTLVDPYVKIQIIDDDGVTYTVMNTNKYDIVEDCNNGPDYIGFDDGIDGITNTTPGNFKEGTGCINLTTTYSSGLAYWENTVTAINMGDRTLKIWFYIANVDDFQDLSYALRFVLGTDGYTDTNVYDIDKDDISSGWNLITLDVENPTSTTGTGATTTTINRLRIVTRLNASQSDNDMRMDLWHLSLDESNYTISASCSPGTTDKLGNFKIKLSNIDGKFLNKFDGGEIVKIFADVTDATTLIFCGKIDDVNYGVNVGSGFYMDIDGRDYPEMKDKSITGVEAGAFFGVAVAGILDTFYSDVTLLFWNGDEWCEATYDSGSDSVSWSPDAVNLPSTAINMTYQHKKGWDVISEMAKRSDVNCYMEYDETNSRWTLKAFNEDTITNTDVNISYGLNLIGLGDYGTENSEIVNRAIVYGKTESDNILLLKTEEDVDSQANLWVKDKVITDGSIDNMDSVQDKVNYELSEGIKTIATGRVKTVCLPTLKHGDNIQMSIPYCNVTGLHRVYSVTHKFDNTHTSNVELAKKVRKTEDLFVPKLNAEEFINSNSNPNNMKDSFTVYFNEDPSIMTNINTVETGGVLSLQDGEINGNAYPVFVTSDYDATECELRRYENFQTANDTYYVSNNGGITWEEYDAATGETHNFSAPGNKLTFKINMSRTATSATSPAYESVCLLYK